MSHIFRDPTDGATARRQDLLRRRREELVMMPHAIRRVYVARRARIIASAAASVAGLALIATALSPAWAATIASGMPGINPAVLSTFVVGMWAIAILAYALSRATGEHQFLVAMSRHVMPGQNLDDDLERLSHERPDAMGRQMAHRLEVPSAALPIAAAGLALPVTALYALHAMRAGGWPVIADFEAAIAGHAVGLAVAAGAGLLAAIAMTKRFARSSQAAPIAAALAIGLAVAALVVERWLAAPALLVATSAVIAWRLRRERTLLETDDPAAGSEVFTWRGLLARVRRLGAAVRAHLTIASARRHPIVAALAAAAAFAVLAMYSTDTSAPARLGSPVAAAMPATAGSAPVVAPSGSSYEVSPTGDGSLLVPITLVDDAAIVVPSLAGLAAIPRGWTARVRVELVGQGGVLAVNPFPDMPGMMQELTAERRDTSFSASSCGFTAPSLGLHARAFAPGRYVLRVTPVLEPAGC